MKTLPLWLTKLFIKTGLINVFTDFFKYARKSVKEVVDEHVRDDDLKAILAYNFGDYGKALTIGKFFCYLIYG